MTSKNTQSKQNCQPRNRTIPLELYASFSRQLSTPMAEFAENANILAVIKTHSLLASRSHLSQMSFEPVKFSANSTRKRLANATVKSIVN